VSAEYRDGILEIKIAGAAKETGAPERRQIPVKKVS
jgi:HSP20 family molecular chaperone IbpA